MTLWDFLATERGDGLATLCALTVMVAVICATFAFREWAERR